MKKVLITFIAVLITFSFAGCNSNTSGTKSTPTPTLTADQIKYNEIERTVRNEFITDLLKDEDKSKLSKDTLQNINHMRDYYIKLTADEMFAYWKGNVTKDECNNQVKQYMKEYFIFVGTAVMSEGKDD